LGLGFLDIIVERLNSIRGFSVELFVQMKLQTQVSETTAAVVETGTSCPCT
jgi:hypothetical protein